jgi:hypothetical protein
MRKNRRCYSLLARYARGIEKIRARFRLFSTVLQRTLLLSQINHRGHTPTLERKKVYDLINCGPRQRFNVEYRKSSRYGVSIANSNFGLIYGMSPGGYQIYARDSYGVHLTLAESRFICEDFFHLYPALPVYHDVYKNFARQHGYVISPLGRVRHLPMITSSLSDVRSKEERRAINAPIQATLSDLTQYAQVEFYRRYPDNNPVQIVMMTHDSLSGYVPKEELNVWMPRLIDTMQTLPLKAKFNWQTQILMAAEAEYGEDMRVPNEFK